MSKITDLADHSADHMPSELKDKKRGKNKNEAPNISLPKEQSYCRVFLV